MCSRSEKHPVSRNISHCLIGVTRRVKACAKTCKTLLPTTTALLQPRYDTDEDARALLGQKEKQRHHYDKNARTLEPLSPGDGVRLRLPGQSTWSRGICEQEVLTQNSQNSFQNVTDIFNCNLNSPQKLNLSFDQALITLVKSWPSLK